MSRNERIKESLGWMKVVFGILSTKKAIKKLDELEKL
jgi:hypothetical protein